MSSKVENQFFVPHNVLEEEKFISLPLSGKVLFMYLCKLQNRLGPRFYRDLETLARETGMHRNTVIAAKKALLKAQYIGVERDCYTASGNRSADVFHLNGFRYKTDPK